MSTEHISPASVQIAHELAAVHGHEWATIPVADIIDGWRALSAADQGRATPTEYIHQSCEAQLGERSWPGLGFALAHRTGGGRGRLSWEIGTGTYRAPEVNIRIHRPSLAWRTWTALQGLSAAAVPDHHVRQALRGFAPFEPERGDLEVLWAHLNTTALGERGEGSALHLTGDLADVRLDHLVSLYTALAAVCRALGTTRPLRELYDGLHALATATEGTEEVDIDLAGLQITGGADSSIYVIDFWGQEQIRLAITSSGTAKPDGEFSAVEHHGHAFGPGLLNLLETRPEVIARVITALHHGGGAVKDPEATVRSAMRALGLRASWTTARSEDRDYVVTIPPPALAGDDLPAGHFSSET